MIEKVYCNSFFLLKRVLILFLQILLSNMKKASTQKDIVLRAVKELVVILAVFLLLQHFGILNRLAPDSLADARMIDDHARDNKIKNNNR